MNETELRSANRTAVERYFQLHGVDRLQLFAEDGSKTIPFNPSHLKGFSWRGLDKLRENFEFNAKDLAEWRFYDMEIIPALDPGFFLVKTMGEGRHARGTSYKNFYLFTFLCREGKIVEVTEYMNPINGMVAGGFQIPPQYEWKANMPAFSGLECIDYSEK